MTRAEFKSLTPQGQWLWVIKNKEQITLIELDNDSTYICADCFKIKEDVECTGSIEMRLDIGDRRGIHHLFSALEIPCVGV